MAQHDRITAKRVGFQHIRVGTPSAITEAESRAELEEPAIKGVTNAHSMDRTRKTATLWRDTADCLSWLSWKTNRSQVELLHEAIVDLAHKIMVEERRAAWVEQEKDHG